MATRDFALLGAIVVAGVACARGERVLVPASAEQRTSWHDRAAYESEAGIELAADAGAWPARHGTLEGITPVKVVLRNGSNRPVRIRYEDFALRDDAGRTFWPASPFDVDRVAATPTAVVAVYQPRGFFIANYLRPYFPTMDAWVQPLPLDRDFATGTWRPRRPTLAMLSHALLEGVVAPGGSVEGFLYFSGLPARARRVVLEANVVGAAGVELASIEMPFAVR